MALLDRFKKTKNKEEPKEEKKPEKAKKEPVQKEVVSDIKDQAKRPLAGTDKEKLIKAYRVIKEPHITEKATMLIDQNKYVFKIFPKANKTEIRKAIKALYGVKVDKIHIVHLAPKKRRLGRHEGWRGGLKKGYKKAIITLKQGEKIELLPR